MADVFYKILQMSISASWLILAVVVLRIFLKKVPRKIICFLWALVAIRLVCPFAIESRFSLIPDTQGIFADYENQLENAGTDNVNAGLPDMRGAVGGALDNEGAAGGNADMASGKLNNEIDNAAGNITVGDNAAGNITAEVFRMEVLRLGISQTKTICPEIFQTFQAEMTCKEVLRTG